MDDFKSDNACDVLSENIAASEAALNCRERSSVNDSFDFEFQKHGVNYILIDDKYEINIDL